MSAPWRARLSIGIGQEWLLRVGPSDASLHNERPLSVRVSDAGPA
jgi:hypothetical protein